MGTGVGAGGLVGAAVAGGLAGEPAPVDAPCTLRHRAGRASSRVGPQGGPLGIGKRQQQGIFCLRRSSHLLMCFIIVKLVSSRSAAHTCAVNAAAGGTLQYCQRMEQSAASHSFIGPSAACGLPGMSLVWAPPPSLSHGPFPPASSPGSAEIYSAAAWLHRRAPQAHHGASQAPRPGRLNLPAQGLSCVKAHPLAALQD